MWKDITYLIGLVSLLSIIFHMTACPKEPPPFEAEGGDNGGVETEADPCVECEAQLQKALEDAAFYMELAENCVDNKVQVKRR